jgi:hypothetical protein
MNSILVIASGVIACAAVSAYAASPYDGSWVGQGQSANCGTKTVTITVVDGAAAGSVVGSGQFQGSIDSTGNGTLTSKGGRSHHVTFSGEKFEFQGDTVCGHLEVVGTRSK